MEVFSHLSSFRFVVSLSFANWPLYEIQRVAEGLFFTQDTIVRDSESRLVPTSVCFLKF